VLEGKDGGWSGFTKEGTTPKSLSQGKTEGGWITQWKRLARGNTAGQSADSIPRILPKRRGHDDSYMNTLVNTQSRKEMRYESNSVPVVCSLAEVTEQSRQ
jgi:hypothetical protein